MGTRGLVGFVYKDTEKLTYNHFDSYPAGLGCDVLDWLKKQDLADLRQQVEALELVDEQESPTQEQYERIRKSRIANLLRLSDNWYTALRGIQGELGKYLELGVMPDNADFALDSLFCEWGYVIDLDTNSFEVYTGFQMQPHDKGRFADRGPENPEHRKDTYYPIRLAERWSLDDLPEKDDFVQRLAE